MATAATSAPESSRTAAMATTVRSNSSAYPVAISFPDPAHGLLLCEGCTTSICEAWVETTTDGGEHWQAQAPFVAYPATDYITVQGVFRSRIQN
jgi:photosystem II stability/assembly factor-like uncharacterized protein